MRSEARGVQRGRLALHVLKQEQLSCPFRPLCNQAATHIALSAASAESGALGIKAHLGVIIFDL